MEQEKGIIHIHILIAIRNQSTLKFRFPSFLTLLRVENRHEKNLEINSTQMCFDVIMCA
jgi:hypothetical protein